ncbi:MAG: serine/threonine-protein kinase, partial [Phycisphaerae bacterium]
MADPSGSWLRMWEIFEAALAKNASERAAFLDQACGGDDALRAQIEKLLSAREAGGEFLETPDEQPTETVSLEAGLGRGPDPSAGSSGPAGRQIGRYRIQRLIGSGGMGTVYEAVQEQPRRTVALKVMRTGLATDTALRRFEYESQILARLRHPCIAQVYEAGTHVDPTAPGEPVPFFAMEYIPDARTITEYAAAAKLGTRERVKLFAQVCDAVHHGHQKGVIHRDLKPGNILVDAQGRVKIIDFGVAKATDLDIAATTLQTDVGQLIGTLQYMSPEQCSADPHEIDTRSDVYALGVVLYELLTGDLPYKLHRAAIVEAVRTIREQEPARPSTWNKTLRGDVETIVLKSLEKERARRYQSAMALAEDLQRYLSSEPIAAHPPSVSYQLRVFARRNRGLIAAVALIFLAVTTGFVVSLSQYFQAESARRQAVAASQDAQEAREAETQQRVVAEHNEQEAKANEALALKRADETKQVAQFQASMLGGIDAEQMGRTILQELRKQVRAGLGRVWVEGDDGRMRKRTAEEID